MRRGPLSFVAKDEHRMGAQVMGLKPTPAESRFWRHVQLPDENGCMTWLASTNALGYGRFNAGKNHFVKAHRFAYEILVGPIPAGAVIDHLCRNPRCVAPDHLEPVTNRENNRRGLRGRMHTHCPHGHAFTEENTGMNNRGHRYCRTCVKARWAAQQQPGWINRGPTGARTHCPSGHPYDESNTLLHKGKRHCRACMSASKRARRALLRNGK